MTSSSSMKFFRIKVLILISISEIASSWVAPTSSSNQRNLLATPSTKLSASLENEGGSKISLKNIADKKVMVIGGSGRVGGSVVCQLTQHNAKVTVGGTRSETFEESRARWKRLFSNESVKFDAISFAQADREDATSIASILQKAEDSGEAFDLVVHTAGPFQGKVKTPNGVIQACVENGVKYLDVCDDYCTASAAKSKYTDTAITNGVPCIVSTGCWVSTNEYMYTYVYACCGMSMRRFIDVLIIFFFVSQSYETLSHVAMYPAGGIFLDGKTAYSICIGKTSKLKTRGFDSRF